MGTGTFVKEDFKPNHPMLLLRGFDLPMLVVVISLIAFGLAMLFSSSWDFSYVIYGDSTYMFNVVKR